MDNVACLVLKYQSVNAHFVRGFFPPRSFALLFLMTVPGLVGINRGAAEIIFGDAFNRAAGDVTNSVPWLDVQGNGWRASGATSLQTDGQGRVYNASTTSGGSAGVQLIPIGRDGSMAASASLNLPVGSSDWIGFGFGNANQFLAGGGSHSSPWLKVHGNGTIVLYGGSGENNGISVSSAYSNVGIPIKFVLTYDAYLGAASVASIVYGLSNSILSAVPVTNTLGAVTAKYLIFQCPTNTGPGVTRWASDVSVDWLPRPRPLLTMNIQHTVNVPAPTGASDIANIKAALDTAAGFSNGAEVVFQAGATYLIATNTTAAGVPLLLVRGTNVTINGNGCKILITNPRVGFMDFYLCKNIIVKGFTVDYDPLPFTQGKVTSISNAQDTFEFRVDPGYPYPTNSYFTEIAQWGTFMDPTRPGRLADNHSTIYEFDKDKVLSTPVSNIFKITLKNHSKMADLSIGDIWCQLARFNGSTLYRTRFSSQVTFLNLTNYTGAAAAFAGNGASLVNEINCQIVIGPSPGGSNGVPRVKTTNADGGLFGNPRIGPWVEGCNFIGLSDDVANANTLPFFIVGPVAQPTNTFYLKAYDPGGGLTDLSAGDVLVGDDVTFYNGTNGVIFARATITNVNPPLVTFDKQISGVFPGLDTTNTCIFDNSLNSSAVYLNNQFANSRIHGIYCRANNMLIAHNYVTGMGASAIAAHPALSLAGPNSFIPTNVIILGNTLADGGVSYEAVHNVDPDEEPVWALLQLHKATANSDSVTNGTEITGIRILNNAFLQWRRGAITLHNASDANIIGNYFGPPMTNDGLTSLTDHVALDLWTCNLGAGGLRLENNVKSALSDAHAIRSDGAFTNITNVFQPLPTARLGITQEPTNVSVTWTTIAPAYVLQQSPAVGTNANWSDVLGFPYLSGRSNIVNTPFQTGSTARAFYRARLR